MENSVPQWLQPASRQRDVILPRQSCSLRDQSNQHSRLHEEGILQRLSR
jgi:hypothetical protein